MRVAARFDPAQSAAMAAGPYASMLPKRADPAAATLNGWLRRGTANAL